MIGITNEPHFLEHDPHQESGRDLASLLIQEIVKHCLLLSSLTKIRVMKKIFVLAFSMLWLAVGCSPDSRSIVEDCKDEGWRVEGEFGQEGPFKSHSHLKSERAKAVEVFWITRGQRKTKRYPQNSKFYLAIHFYKEDGDVFAVVMSKNK